MSGTRRRHRFALVVDQHAQPGPHLLGPESMAAQPHHQFLHRVLALFDPLLR